jgi:hypothetical protein
MAVLFMNTCHCHGGGAVRVFEGQGIGFRGDVQKGRVEELFVVCHGDFPQFKKNPPKSNSDNQRECMDIKYSIGGGSLVKPTGLTLYSKKVYQRPGF